MSSVELLVFRHGQTDWNRDHLLQGHSDIPLNDIGRRQAEALGVALADFDFEVVLSSDLVRAKETAEIATLSRSPAFHLTSDLRECHLGEAEGIHRDEISRRYGEDFWRRWKSNHPEDHEIGLPGGETKRQHKSRVIGSVEKFCRSHPDLGTLAVSTHGLSLVRLIQHCHNTPGGELLLPNCALVLMRFDLKSSSWTFVEIRKGQDVE